MKRSLREIQKRRVYSEEFKKELVSLFESGKFSVNQIMSLYGVGKTSMYRWIYKYSHFNKKGYRIVEKKQSASQKLKELEQKIKELERTVGQKQIQIDFLEKMIDIAKDDLGVDIKKNSDILRSGGSGRIKKK